MKRMLIIGVALVVALTMSVVAFGYDYNTQDDVYITLDVSTVMILDLGDGTADTITWASVEAGELNQGYTVMNDAVSFTVSSNEPTGWHVTMDPDTGWFTTDVAPGSATDAEMPLSDFSWRSHWITSGDMENIATTPVSWTLMTTAGTAATVVTSTATDNQCQGAGAEFGMDYKMVMTWDVDPATYYLKLTFTLLSGIS